MQPNRQVLLALLLLLGAGEFVFSKEFFGKVVLWAGTQPPPGWLLCSGSAIDCQDNPDFCTVLDSFESGGDIFVPNLDAKFIRTAGNAGGIGEEQGERFHTLGTSEMPAHSHLILTTLENATSPNVANNFLGTADNETYGFSGS
eukprot:TRINITY_DN18815_c0_g1_i1.p1 TRINITY_DN18815_c0_g1~~TRINITY_DN18815_c0_g1_i1.p1  ORF type:complete len:144 (+),score=25.77 TRINITY_DN18815_c0_g1_i1:83-514(+)